MTTIDKFFQKYSGQEQLRADLKEARSTWPGIKSLIDYLLICKMDYIIEGIHLLPSFVKQYESNKDVRIVFLTKLDEKKIYKGLFKNKDNSDWLMDNARSKETLKIAAKAMSEYGKFFLKETRRYDLKCFNTEDEFLKKITTASGYLEN